MKVLMTSGTVDYLLKIKQKYPEANIQVMQNVTSGLAYYEGNNDEVFEEERIYETVDMVGEMQDEGFVVMNHIPVTDEGRPIFEDRFKNRSGKIEDMPGFQALRILRPEQRNTYIVLSQWADEDSFISWKNSLSFKEAHKQQDAKKQEKPSYSAGDSYVTQYHMVVGE
ncbi:antibiotic biosynthesis monooxygenase family protein [Salinibacillus xinjiangensis]|uniref:Antibiotic biosynthesis monooxygenase n=1 Tax=Salinibacillus xinjiangensis TaxID=1229268 RepID=A0A6G1X7N8_9BACI|nr:antibiotic biosynthesis monooxygenase [Salinibacillus xinjiangensis]MRG86949.1 antibiotic biosynthesis monooxygenase [Salinibacillus xinjiangensis]